MEKPETPGTVSGVDGESGKTKRVPGDIRGVEADSRMVPGIVSVPGSGPPLQSGGNVVCSPGSSQRSGEVAVFSSIPSQHPGEVAVHSFSSGTYRGGLNPTCPAASVCCKSSLGFGGPGVYTSGSSRHSGSTCLHSLKPREDWPRSILKSNSVLKQKSPTAKQKGARLCGKKCQHWDEMNILATYHPADKDYGFIKMDEPSTPYLRLQDSNEDLSSASSNAVTPEMLKERFATMDNFCPKVLRYGDNRRSRSPNKFSKTHSSDFDKHRKAHYDEGKFLKAQKNLLLDNNKNSNGGGVSMSNDAQDMMLDPEPRPAKRGWARRLDKEAKEEIDLVARNDILEAKDSSTWRNQSLDSSTTVLKQKVNQQRKEYYIKGRYLRCWARPELEEDTEDEQDSSSGLTWVYENPIVTEVRLLDYAGVPFQDNKATKNSLAETVTPSQPDKSWQLDGLQEEECRQWKNVAH